MKAVLAALIAASAVALPAQAGQGRWTTGYGQGITEASVSNANGATFRIACPDRGVPTTPAATLEIRGMTGGANQDGVGTLFLINTGSVAFPLNRVVLDQNQVIFNRDATTPRDRRELRALSRALQGGSSVTIAIPSSNVRETFSLAGSGAALRECQID